MLAAQVQKALINEQRKRKNSYKTGLML